jgi:hypothetical protein
MRKLIDPNRKTLLRILLCVFAPFLMQTASAQTISFNRDVRPILSDKCFQCHGPDEETREADLRFDQKESAFESSAIVPGDVDASEMIVRIHEEDPDLRMPPEETAKPLTEDEIEILTRWIREGANWSEFWAYVPPRNHPTPRVENESWPRNWIDHFTLAAIEAANLKPAKQADKVTLLRRLHFDLTGLPPRAGQVKAFAGSDKDSAYEELVDRLLESKHFGERLAIYWLDLVRYADTVGYHGDQDHNISPYRDWVINSHANNSPATCWKTRRSSRKLLRATTACCKRLTRVDCN